MATHPLFVSGQPGLRHDRLLALRAVMDGRGVRAAIIAGSDALTWFGASDDAILIVLAAREILFPAQLPRLSAEIGSLVGAEWRVAYQGRAARRAVASWASVSFDRDIARLMAAASPEVTVTP